MRHSRLLEATKDIFYPFMSSGEWKVGSDPYALGGHVGFRVHDVGNQAYVEPYIPWNHHFLVEGRVAFIAIDPLMPMTFRVETNYCSIEVGYDQHGSVKDYAINTVPNRLQECDITQALISLTDGAPLEAGDRLGIGVSRQAGQNTDALFLGARIRYDTPIYARAP